MSSVSTKHDIQYCTSPIFITRSSRPRGVTLDSPRLRSVSYVDRGTGASPPQPPVTSLNTAEDEISAPLASRTTATSASTTSDTGPATINHEATASTAASAVSNTTHAATPSNLAIKRHASDESSGDEQMTDASAQPDVVDDSPTKKARADDPPLKVVPTMYEDCDVRDLVLLISSMLLELISYNDAIPLQDGHLTRFHSRAPPGISVQDYLQRLTTHATLSPPILLSMVYYIDRLCAMYPAFTITSLTVHRFLIASATVASKGLSDSFWTNKTYAKVGGVSLRELGLLELDFLTRLEWKIVPKPEVLVDYYRSLVNRSETHMFDQEPT